MLVQARVQEEGVEAGLGRGRWGWRADAKVRTRVGGAAPCGRGPALGGGGGAGAGRPVIVRVPDEGVDPETPGPLLGACATVFRGRPDAVGS